MSPSRKLIRDPRFLVEIGHVAAAAWHVPALDSPKETVFCLNRIVLYKQLRHSDHSHQSGCWESPRTQVLGHQPRTNPANRPFIEQQSGLLRPLSCAQIFKSSIFYFSNHGDGT